MKNTINTFAFKNSQIEPSELLRRLDLLVQQINETLQSIKEPAGATGSFSASNKAGKGITVSLTDGQITSLGGPGEA